MERKAPRVVRKGTPFKDPKAPFLGKGSASRVSDKARYDANWDLIFGTKANDAKSYDGKPN